MPPALEVLPDAEAVAGRGAALVVQWAQSAIAERGLFTLAVSGGRTPWRMLALLGERLPWERVALYQVDERIAPDGHPDRTLTRLLETLPATAASSVRAMPVTATDLEAAAARYAAALPDRLDLVHLGLGADGHTASLVPGDRVLDASDRAVAPTGEYEGLRRMTLTYPTLDRARRQLWLVTGEEKREALRRLLAGDTSLPAARVRTEHAIVLADRAAAGGAG
ncbi:MAG: 6-phosphogluconolactonase [Gaiellaceae bacterium]|nr:MAG: 6-phosphogluconolactonase [Gaiellaceae bacterium]